MRKTFLNCEKPTITAMVQADNPDRIKELIDKCLPEGAEAFGMQFEQMKPEYRTREVYEDLFSYSDKPIYVTNYRLNYNEEKSDEELAEELLELAECGATLCDGMGDPYDRQPDEVAVSEEAIKKQMELIDELHKKGAEVLMSSHIFKFTSAERVLEIALEHQRRGADISKIVTQADSTEEEIENLRILNLLKEKVDIPVLFLYNGHSRVFRKISGEYGNCMYLCVYEYDEFAASGQPLLADVKPIVDHI